MTSPVPIPTHELVDGAVKLNTRSLVFSGMLRAKLMVVAAPSEGLMLKVEVEKTWVLRKLRRKDTVLEVSTRLWCRLDAFAVM